MGAISQAITPDINLELNPYVGRMANRLVRSFTSDGSDADRWALITEVLGFAAEAEQLLTEQRQRIAELESLTTTDALTGVANRRGFENFLQRALANGARHGETGVIAVMDLDGFKQINDRHGHLVGDQVLRQFAQTLQRLLRSTDLVARYGGEEFLVVLAHSNEAAAARVLRRILEETARTPMAVVDGHPLYVTFSAGVASRDGHDSPFADARAMLQAADQALYLAKRRGRNQVGQHGQ